MAVGSNWICNRSGPGMTCVGLDGCDTSESNHFYITQNPNTIHLHPREINLHRGNLANVRNDKEKGFRLMNGF